MSALLKRLGITGRGAVVSVPYLWLLLFFLVPFAIVMKISFSSAVIAMPPYEPLLHWASDKVVEIKLNLGNYMFLVQDDLYWKAYLNSIKVAAISTFFCLLLGYPIAYSIARSNPSTRNILMLLVVLPFWTSFLLRVYAWKGLLSENGLVADLLENLGIDNLLLAAGLIPALGKFMNSPFSLVLGMVYTYLPFMILPLYGNLAKMDLRLLEAATDLGATPFVAFWTVTVPISKAGIIAGSMLVFIPCVGEFVIPELLGGPQTLMIGRVLWDEFFSNNDWPMASTVAVVMILLILVPLGIFNRYQARAQEARR